MARFRKKPVVIEAWRIGSFEPMPEWAKGPNVTGNGVDYLEIRTLHGIIRADRGDWLIKCDTGRLYSHKNDMFEQSYEPSE